jgi:hypothetical protein
MPNTYSIHFNLIDSIWSIFTLNSGTDAHNQKKDASVTTPNSGTDAHNQKIRKIEVRYSLIVGVQTPPKQLLKSMFFESDTSKKETWHKSRHPLIKDRRFSP